MAEHDDLAVAVARLEAALARIAAAAERPRPEPAATAQDQDTAEIAARLDTIIEEVRAALGPTAKEPA